MLPADRSVYRSEPVGRGLPAPADQTNSSRWPTRPISGDPGKRFFTYRNRGPHVVAANNGPGMARFGWFFLVTAATLRPVEWIRLRRLGSVGRIWRSLEDLHDIHGCSS